MKSLYEAKEILENLKKDKMNCKNSEKASNESNHNEGWIEALEIILDLYDRNKDEVANRRILEYKKTLDNRYSYDIEVYGKDATDGWLVGSIEAIEWFFKED